MKSWKTQTRKFQCDSLVLVYEDLSIDFVVFLVKIMQRTNTLKVEYAIEMKFFLGKWLWGAKIPVNLHTFTAGRQACGRRAEHV